jgi:hypothetical protein
VTEYAHNDRPRKERARARNTVFGSIARSGEVDSRTTKRFHEREGEAASKPTHFAPLPSEQAASLFDIRSQIWIEGAGRVDLGDCSPRPPTDPDVRD